MHQPAAASRASPRSLASSADISTTRRPPPSRGTRITMPRPSLVTSRDHHQSGASSPPFPASASTAPLHRGERAAERLETIFPHRPDPANSPINTGCGSHPGVAPGTPTPARQQVCTCVVDEAGGLHQCVTGGGPDETEAAALELRAMAVDSSAGRRHVGQRAGRVPAGGSGADMSTQARRRGSSSANTCGVVHRCVDLGPVPADVRVGQSRATSVGRSGHRGRSKPAKALRTPGACAGSPARTALGPGRPPGSAAGQRGRTRSGRRPLARRDTPRTPARWSPSAAGLLSHRRSASLGCGPRTAGRAGAASTPRQTGRPDEPWASQPADCAESGRSSRSGPGRTPPDPGRADHLEDAVTAHPPTVVGHPTPTRRPHSVISMVSLKPTGPTPVDASNRLQPRPSPGPRHGATRCPGFTGPGPASGDHLPRCRPGCDLHGQPVRCGSRAALAGPRDRRCVRPPVPDPVHRVGTPPRGVTPQLGDPWPARRVPLPPGPARRPADEHPVHVRSSGARARLPESAAHATWVPSRLPSGSRCRGWPGRQRWQLLAAAEHDHDDAEQGGAATTAATNR